MKNKIFHTINKILNFLFILAGLTGLYILINLFCFTSFLIPSDSMEPTIISGNRIIVNKILIGGRLFNIAAAMKNEKIDITRLPGLKKIEYNDIIVFNFPYPCNWDSISFDINKYYVKRCIALPGDTLNIINGFYKVNNYEGTLGNQSAQIRISEMDNEIIQELPVLYPRNSIFNWGMKNFGPFYIPKKGDIIHLNEENIILYKNLIEWEQREKIRKENEIIYIGNTPSKKYLFQKNYYFVSGDKLDNSQDSRYWGVLPEELIVGIVTFIWK